MKKVLFMMHNMPVGGIAKALLGVLNSIDYSKYEVSLGLFEHSGIFFDEVPKEVNVLPELFLNRDMYILPLSNFKIVWKRSKKLGMKWLANLLKFSIIRLFRGREVYYYKYCKKLVKDTIDIDEEFDAVVAFASQHNIYYAVDKIKAKKKIGFIHNDYSKTDYKYKCLDDEYFPKLDYLATISTECVDVLNDYFPDLISKTLCIPNIVSCNDVVSKSNLYFPEEMLDRDFKYIVTLCRISIDCKGLDYAVQASKKLKDMNVKFKWLIVGGGCEEAELRSMIVDNELQDHMIITGVKKNPYPYISNCDLFAQPSRYEGKSICVDEAKILHKPILLTNYTTAKDQINHLQNGYICDMNSDALACAVDKLLTDTNLTNGFVEMLNNEDLDNTDEVLAIYDNIL